MGQEKGKGMILKKCYGEEAVQMVKKLKASIDPNNYLNKGNLIN